MHRKPDDIAKNQQYDYAAAAPISNNDSDCMAALREMLILDTPPVERPV